MREIKEEKKEAAWSSALGPSELLSTKQTLPSECLFLCRIVAPSGRRVGPHAETEAFNGVCFKSPTRKAFNIVAKLLYANLND